jgi:hypothetical protein
MRNGDRYTADYKKVKCRRTKMPDGLSKPCETEKMGISNPIGLEQPLEGTTTYCNNNMLIF